MEIATDQPALKVDVRAFLRDVQAGLDDHALMARHGVSSRGLDRVFRSLVHKGLLRQSDLDERSRLVFRAVASAKSSPTPPRAAYGDNWGRTRGIQGFFRPEIAWFANHPRIAETRRPVFIAAYLVVSVLVVWGACLLMDRDMWVSEPSDPVPVNTSVPRWQGGPQSPGRGMPSPASLPPELQSSRAEELLDGIISGDIHHSELGELSSHPDYDTCKRCLEECEQVTPGKDQEECRRECLTNCSTAAKLLLNR